MKVKIYSIHNQIVTDPAEAAYLNHTFRLPALTGFERHIKKIIYFYQLYDAVTGSPIPLAMNTVFNTYLRLYSFPDANIANNVDLWTLPSAPDTGFYMYFLEPGEYNFNGLIHSKETRWNIQFRNTDPVAQIIFRYSFIIETEEKPI